MFILSVEIVAFPPSYSPWENEKNVYLTEIWVSQAENFAVC